MLVKELNKIADDAKKYPLAMRIAMKCHAIGITQVKLQTLNKTEKCFQACGEPLYCSILNALRDIELQQTGFSPKQLDYLKSLADKL